MHLYLLASFTPLLLRLMLQHSFYNCISPFAMMIYFFIILKNII